MGRAKIEIKKIEKEGNRKVTFLKRRKGMLKKAYEISVLADVEVVLITFAPYSNKLCLFSRPNRLEDVLIKFLNMSDEHHIVRDENGQETRIEISNKESLITLLENLKLEDDTWEAEKLRIKQANSGPKTSYDVNQPSQYIEMMNSLSNLQQLHQFKRFYETAPPTTFEECFDYNEEMLKFMLFQVTQRMNFVQSMTMNSMSLCPYHPMMIHGESSDTQSSGPYNPMIHGESSNTQSLLQQLQENWSLGNQTNAGLMNMQQQQLQENFINRQQGLAAFHDQKNKQGQGSAYNINQQQQPSVLKWSRHLVISEPNPSSRKMKQGQQSAELEWRQELDNLFDHKNKGKMINTEPNPAFINVQQGQGSAYNMKQQGLAAVFDQKNKGKMVNTEPNPASINMQQGQGSVYNMQQQQHSVHGWQQGLTARHDQKNKGKLVIREPNPAPIQQQQQWASPYQNNMSFLTKGSVQQGQGSACNNMQLQQQGASQYQNNGNMLHGSVQAPVQTYNGAGLSNKNNERIYPKVEQNNYNQMELPTGANSSHGLRFAPPMLPQNASWNPTYHTTEPPHYGHQQSFGDDGKNSPDLGQYNDKPNSK